MIIITWQTATVYTCIHTQPHQQAQQHPHKEMNICTPISLPSPTQICDPVSELQILLKISNESQLTPHFPTWNNCEKNHSEHPTSHPETSVRRITVNTPLPLLKQLRITGNTLPSRRLWLSPHNEMVSSSLPLSCAHNEMVTASLPLPKRTMKWRLPHYLSLSTMKWHLPHYLSLSTEWNGVCLTTSDWTRNGICFTTSVWTHNEMAYALLPLSEHTLKWRLPHYLCLITQWNGVCLSTSALRTHNEMASALLPLFSEQLYKRNGVCLTTSVFWTHNEMVSASLPLLSEHNEMVPASLPLTVWIHKRFKLSSPINTHIIGDPMPVTSCSENVETVQMHSLAHLRC